MRIKRNLLLVLFIAFFCNIALSDNQAVISNEKPTTWTLLKENSGIQVFYKYADCNDVKNGIFQEMVYIKIVNTTKLNVTLDWDLKLWYNDKCINCNNNDKEHHYSINLNAGETKSGSCETRHELSQLVMFSKFLNMENKNILSKFSMENFNVSPL